jgi:hypothetical protein
VRREGRADRYSVAGCRCGERTKHSGNDGGWQRCYAKFREIGLQEM